MDTFEPGAPFLFSTGTPPTATSIDDDIYLTVTAAVPDCPGRLEAIDIILSLEDAQAAVAALNAALAVGRGVADR